MQTAHAGEKITIAAAADLKFALDEIVVLFGKAHPVGKVETIYGSSGMFQAQIRQGAPFDLHFSVRIVYQFLLSGVSGSGQLLLPRITRRSCDRPGLVPGMEVFARVRGVALIA